MKSDRVMKDRSGKGNKLSWIAVVFIVIIAPIVLAVVGGMVYGTVIMPFMDAEHYLQVRNNPVTVMATVTSHDSYDDEGDTDYQSYVTYVYDGVRYQDLSYEDRDEEADLTPIGTEVSLQISPKDPTKQIADLKRHGRFLPFSVALISLVVVGVYTFLQRRKLSKGCYGTPDTDMVQQDIKVKVRSRFSRPFWLLCGAGCGLLHWRYSLLLEDVPLTVAGVCGVFWLYCMYTTIRDYRRGENEDFEVRRDVLIEKRDLSDSDGDAYYLHYQNGDRTWKVSTNAKNFRNAKVGDTVVAVYLAGKKKPILHYNQEGDAR